MSSMVDDTHLQIRNRINAAAATKTSLPVITQSAKLRESDAGPLQCHCLLRCLSTGQLPRTKAASSQLRYNNSMTTCSRMSREAHATNLHVLPCASSKSMWKTRIRHPCTTNIIQRGCPSFLRFTSSFYQHEIAFWHRERRRNRAQTLIQALIHWLANSFLHYTWKSELKVFESCRLS